MSVQITYFVHGTTTDNERGISSGWFDVELSVRGVRESKELRGIVMNRKFETVFCSDLKRAANSARFAFEGFAPIVIDERLRECNYGIFNDKPSSIVEPMLEKNIKQRFPGGESCEDVKNRMADFLQLLKQNYEGKHVAIVAHKVTQLALDVLLKNKTWKQAFAEDWRKTKAWQPGWEYVAD